MEHADVVVVGGGPAGSTCAGRLRAGGLDVVLLDKARFPRPKPCAGWITPAVLDELRIEPDRYAPGRVLQPMTGFRVGLIGGRSLSVTWDRPVSFGIRRIELDDYLLNRCGARLHLGEPLATLRRRGEAWIVNERIESPMLVAAGGHFCPVGRLLALADRPGGGQTPFFKDPSGGPLIVSQEIELELSPEQQARLPIDPEVPEVYFCRDLLGYGWCIRKGNYLNIGLGRADRRQLPRHVADFCQYLQTQNRIPPDLPHGFVGHAYLLYQQSARPLVADGTLWIGDSAGLAYPQSGEGIRPAVESGLMAAEAILAAGGDYRPAALEPYRRRVEARFGRRPKRPPVEEPPSALRRLAARWLLARPWFVRRVLLERWFLHCSVPPLSACGYNAEVRS